MITMNAASYGSSHHLLFVIAILILVPSALCSWILPMSRFTPIPVPALPDLRQRITNIRNFQYMMDRMDLEDLLDPDADLRMPVAAKLFKPANGMDEGAGANATVNSTTPSNKTVNSQQLQYQASPQLLNDMSEVAGGMPSLPTRSPQSEFVNKLVVIDVPRSIIQSIRTFSGWMDRMLSGWGARV